MMAEKDLGEKLTESGAKGTCHVATIAPRCEEEKYHEFDSMLIGDGEKKEKRHGLLHTSPTDDSLPKRDTWSSHTEFILSMVGSCVGLGNVWRFPYLCYKNGGGAFLVPYLLAAFCAGIPMFMLEVSMGQFYSKGCINSWGACPPFKGIGIGGTVMCVMSNIYFIIVVAWVFFYLWHSLSPVLPWATCENSWNQRTCVLMKNMPSLPCTTAVPSPANEHHDSALVQALTGYHLHPTPDVPSKTRVVTTTTNSFWNANRSGTISNVDFFKDFSNPGMNWSNLFNYSEIPTELSNPGRLSDQVHCLVQDQWIHRENITEPVREFWERKVLKISPGLHELGPLNIDMTVTLVVCWVICYFCIWKGIRWTGKIVYFTALMPYVLLLVLLVKTLMLPGSTVGLRYFIVPDIAKLANVEVWLDAVSQVFYSYALAFGSLVTFGSYNKFTTNCYRDSLLIAVINSGTSILSGVIVFSVVGFMSHTLNKPVEEVALSGPGLAFLVYPAATNEMPHAWIWSTFFFFTLFMIGLDTEFCFVESVITAFTDLYPRQLRPHKELFTAVVCIASLLLGLTCVTEGGMYVFQLIDAYGCSGLCLVFLVFWSSVAMGWGYGANKWLKNIEVMIGYSPGRWWSLCWRFVVPCITLAIFWVNVALYTPLTYVNYVYPTWGNAIGWAMALSSMLWVPGYFIYYVVTVKKKKTFKENLQYIFRPDTSLERTQDGGCSQGLEC